NPGKRALAAATLRIAIWKAEIPPQSLRKNTGGECHVSPGNPPNSARSKNLRRDVPSRSADRQHVGIAHCPDVEGQVGVISRQQMPRYSKHCCEELAFQVKPRPVCRIEPTEDQFMGGK